MQSTVLVKQAGATTIKNHSGEKATASASVKAGGKVQLLIDGRDGIFEQLDLMIEQPKTGYKGTYTLRSKDNADADVFVNYYRTNSVISNLYKSDHTVMEGSLEITDYNSASKRETISGTYRIVLKDVKNPDKDATTATDADNSDVTITGTFKDAWLTN